MCSIGFHQNSYLASHIPLTPVIVIVVVHLLDMAEKVTHKRL
jgi:hypothetical protein